MDLFVLKSLEKIRAQAGWLESDIKEAVDSTSSELQFLAACVLCVPCAVATPKGTLCAARSRVLHRWLF
jgi:hypothetical protein